MSATLPDELSPYLESETKAGSSALATVAVAQAHKIGRSGVRLDLALAATFDLLVAAKFYQDVKPENWLWCEAHGYDVYPVLNACPLCIFENQFVFHEGNKPGSGNIGPATAGALRELLAAHYALTKQTGIRIFNGSEPVDLAVVDDDTKKIFMAGHVAGGHGALRGEVVIFDLLGVGVDRKGDDGGSGRHVFAELLFVGSKARGIHGLVLREGLNVRDVRRELRIAIGKRGKRLDGRCVAVAYSLDRKKH